MAPMGHRGGTLALLLAAGVLALLVPSIPASAAGGCATPGRDGTASLTGVINTYYPGTATATATSTTITLGAATGAPTSIAIGDLVLVIQMQDAAIDSTNTGAYGDGVAGDPATGWTALNSAGLYEYAVATSAVPLAGGSLTVSTGLINTYTRAAPTATQGQRDFQVIRVPQYVAATLTAGLTAARFNGSTGGVLVFDVDGALNLNGAAVSVSQGGFRGGLGRQLAGGAGGSGTDYVNLSANPFHAQKGEGIAGTPQYLYESLTGTTVNNGADGYPNGSTARGAPATAGGGGTDPHPTGNDENTGGGGGANGGAGGVGGNSWNSNLAVGGFGGTAFPATAARVTAGAGGGAGTRNNSPAIANASSGGSGGGIVMIRTGSVAGAGSVTADGGTGVVPNNDGGGGGGSGGSVVVVTQTGGLAGLTINARGGAGANAWPAQAGGAAGVNYHGPGGGGGGGVVLTTSVPTAVSVLGGVNGTTTTDLAAYGATPGGGGTNSIITAGQIPGAGSGASCTSDLTIAKSHTDPFVRGSNGTFQLTVGNIGGTATSGTTTVTDTLPAGLTPTVASGTGWSCGIVAQTVTCTSTDVVASNGSFPAIAITVNVAQSAANSVTNTATASGGGEVNTANDTATDLTNMVSSADIAVAKIASSGTVTIGSNVTFTITVTNNGPSDATGVQVTDQLPAGLTFVSATPSQGTYTSATGVWNIGAIASGASVTLTLIATVTTTGAHINTATKTAENETDPNLANDSASAGVNGNGPDLTIAKSHIGSFVRGSTGSYGLTVSNIGPVASSGLVTVTDTVPAGLTPSLASGGGWVCGIAAQIVTCTRSDALAAAATYPVITITVAVAQSATTPLTNTATVSGGNDINLANNTASDPTTVTSAADVSVAKTASSGAVAVGSNVTFTITVDNLGPTDATGVQVTDVLPSGLTFVSATPASGTYTAGTGVWNIGSLASGATTTTTIIATVTVTGTIANTATKSAQTEPDPNSGNDSATASITGQPAPGLPGPPNGGMAPLSGSTTGAGPGGTLFLGAALAGFLGLLFVRGQSRRTAIAVVLLTFASLTIVLPPSSLTGAASAPAVGQGAGHLTPAQLEDVQRFGKPISTIKPEIGVRVPTLHPASGPITPSRLRIPALGIDTMVEPVGVTARGLMDVPANIWNAAWLRSGVKPGALGQAVIDGHLDSVAGTAVFGDLSRLHPGDRIYVSDEDGGELGFRVAALRMEPLDGFPTLRVFGPAKGRFLNLITCAGRYDPARRTYDHRLVVFTEIL